MRTAYKLIGLGVVAANGVADSFRTYAGVWLVTIATIFAVGRIAYISGIVRGQGL